MALTEEEKARALVALDQLSTLNARRRELHTQRENLARDIKRLDEEIGRIDQQRSSLQTDALAIAGEVRA